MSTSDLADATKDLSLDDSVHTALTSEAVELKHPLNTKWTLWYTKPSTPDSKESWADLLRPVITFGTVEEFWGIFNSIPTVKDLPFKGDYHLFREGIRPEWEDEANAQGGKWTYQFIRSNDLDINDIWLRGLLALIGETIQDDEDEVNGIVFNNRKFGYRIGLWTKSTIKRNLFEIGERFKKVLKLRDQDNIEFFSHKDAESKNAKPVLSI